MRLRSDVWVSAYLRRCAVQGGFAVLRRRGSAESGAIFIRIDRLDGQSVLYGPAPQFVFGAGESERRFARLHEAPWISGEAAEQRIASETRFDPDLWIVDVDDRSGRSFLLSEEEANG